jgi:hypothetical protein
MAACVPASYHCVCFKTLHHATATFADDAINMNDVTRSCLKVYQNIRDEGMRCGGPDVWPAVDETAMFMTHA